MFAGSKPFQSSQIMKCFSKILTADSKQPLHCDKFRSSHPEVFHEKGVLKTCSKFTGEQPCRSGV